MSVKSYQYAFGAGETKQYRGGDYFTLADSSSDVTLEIFSPRGTSLGKLENIGAGFWMRMPEENGVLGRIDVTSASAQTINVIVGNGEFGVNKTTTNINGGNLDSHTSGSFYSAKPATTAIQTVETPAANVNGIRINNVTLIRGSGDGSGGFSSKTSAPSSATDVTARMIMLYSHSASNGLQAFNSGSFPFIIPAGEGLYFGVSLASCLTGSISYEVL